MAKTYYSPEEASAKLGCTNDELRAMIREGKLREFRDAGKPSYRVEEVDRLAAERQGGQSGAGQDSGELSLADSGEIELESLGLDSGQAEALPASGSSDSLPGLSGSEAAIDLGSSDTGAIQLEDSATGDSFSGDSGIASQTPKEKAPSESEADTGELALIDERDESGVGGDKVGLGGSDTGTLDLAEESSGGSDFLSLEEVDKDAAQPVKKDDTVITNIGISVFDDDDLEIAADPMAKTLLTGGDEHLGLDGSGGGSGLLDLTRESDDTSLGAELLEGIDMGDTAETVAPTVETEPVEPVAEIEEPMGEPTVEIGLGRTQVVGLVEPVSPAFTGLLAAATISLALLGAASVANSMGAWPGYLQALSEKFWLFLGGMLVLGGMAAGIGFFVGKQPSGPRPPKEKKAKTKKAKKGKKGKKGQADEPKPTEELA